MVIITDLTQNNYKGVNIVLSEAEIVVIVNCGLIIYD